MDHAPEEILRVTIDPQKCQGHSRCYGLVPDIFDVDDMGQAVILGDGVVSPEFSDRVRLAAANCPEFAIQLDKGSR
ncbi:MAG: ferredoxin [Gemmatimonadales bacterium]|nr:ferredoxin [Gemmatimonadales bacterium]MBT3499916.1 ferredoxin [Gemmatimonadales bacterium]MBT3774289.1 ferredoxin [Gemmatimonadales bacterium]MBT3957877.1 ferredoxin [Gemmatimonadales bacterium]MBT4188467.1 ferredoxin [Gemmatimonadales bacterium]